MSRELLQLATPQFFSLYIFPRLLLSFLFLHTSRKMTTVVIGTHGDLHLHKDVIEEARQGTRSEENMTVREAIRLCEYPTTSILLF